MNTHRQSDLVAYNNYDYTNDNGIEQTEKCKRKDTNKQEV